MITRDLIALLLVFCASTPPEVTPNQFSPRCIEEIMSCFNKRIYNGKPYRSKEVLVECYEKLSNQEEKGK